MKNIQNLTIDINKKPFQTITANVGEVASRFIRITILENNIPADLTGVTAYLYAKKADGTKVFNSVTVENAKKGIVLAELTSQVLAIPGLVRLTLLLTKDGAKLTSKQIIVTVDESNIDEEAIQSSNEFNAFTDALRNINNIDNKVWSMANMGQDVKEAMTGGSVAVVGKNTILAENIVDGQVTEDKVSFLNKVNPLNLFNSKSTNNQIGFMHKNNGTIEPQQEMIVTHKIPVKEGKRYTISRIQSQWGGFYSSSGTLVQAIGVAGDNENYTITAPTNSTYMLLNCYKGGIDTYMVVEGDIMPSVYVPYIENPYSLSESIAIPRLEEMKKQVDNTSLYIKKYENLFDKNNNDIKEGVYYNGSNKITESEHSRAGISHLISVKPGEKYIYKAYREIYGNNIAGWVFDENENPLSLISNYVTSINDGHHLVVTVPNNDSIKYIRVNLAIKDIEDFMFIPGEVYPNKYVPYGAKVVNNGDLDSYAPTINLFNKNHNQNVVGQFINGLNSANNSNFVTSHPIKVTPGETYSYKFYGKALGSNKTFQYLTQTRVVVSYGENGVLDEENEVMSITVPNDPNIDYIRVNVLASQLDNFMFVKGNNFPNEYIPYGQQLNSSIYIDKLQTNTKQLNEVSKNVEELKTFFVKHNNLFDKNNSDVYIGGYFNSFRGGINTQFSKYIISHFIEVEEGKSYCYPATTSQFGTNNKTYVCYDKNKEIISAYDLRNAAVDTDNDILHIKIPKGYGVKYIRVNLHQQTYPNFMIVEGDEYPSEFIPYGLKMSDDIEFSDNQKAKIAEISAEVITNSTTDFTSPLAYKTIALNGDSICQGSVNGGGYGKIIAERYNMNYQNVAVGGGTITAETYSSSGGARHWISRTISKMRDDADYVVLEGGVNDASLNVPLGEITSNYTSELDDTTYCGAFESMLKQVLEKYPGKKIGYILVHKMTKNFDSRYENNHYQMSKQICEKWGVPCLDLNIECPPLNYIQSLREAYTTNSDGWHPNVEGYEKYYVDKIVKWLEAL